MESRGQKRAEIVDELPADKRACSSMEFRASSSGSSSVQTNVNSAAKSGDMDTSSHSSQSEEGEIERVSPYNSCDSDDEDPRHSFLRECQLRRSSGDRGKLERILTGLKEECDPSGQLAALTELCDLLNYCTEDSFSSQMSDSLSPLLVKLTNHAFNPDMMLLAIRAMTYMCDVYPRSSSFLIRHGAVPALCGKLVAIEYLDVAEQCLQALEKISRNQPLACLEAGAVMAVLRYADFFSTNVQRVAVSTVVNICKKLPSECPPSFVEAVPILCNLLQYEDHQLVENVATCIIKIAERVSQSSESLHELCRHGVIQQVMHLINSNSRASLSKETYNGFIGLLTKLCSGSILAFRTLYELSISSILKDLFSSHDGSHGSFLPSIADAHHNQVHEVLRLLHELLPASARSQDVQLVSDKELFLISKPELLQKFAEDMLPLLFQVVNSGARVYVCYGCLSVIDKLVCLSKSDMLVQSLKNSNIASFLAGVLSQKDPHVQILALQIANVILQRHSDAFLEAFVKEGVFFAIHALSTPDNSSEEIFPPVSGVELPVDMSQKPAGKGLVQCLCYAFSTGLAPSPSELRTCKLEKDSVTLLAKRIRTDCFTPESCGPELGLTNILKQLKTLAYTLNDLTERHVSYDPSCEQEFQHILKELIEKVTGREPVSTFEFIESGIVKSLVNYLYSSLHGRDNKESYDYHTLIKVVDRRFEMFARTFLSSSDDCAEASSLSALTRKLQSALSFFENFPVVFSHAPKRRNSFAMVPNGCCVAHPSLKVRFVREDGETCLSDYPKDYVTVDPFCSLDAIERFLWSKVNKSRTEQVKSPPSAVNQTESLPCQLSAVAQSGKGNSSGCSESTGNQHEPSTLTNMQEYEYKFSQFASELEMELRQANPTGSSSFDECLTVSAQNNMQVPSEADKNSRTQNHAICSTTDYLPKLLLCLEGNPLNHRLTLYQAILQQQMKSEQHIKLGQELWSQVHTITYKRAVGAAQDNPQETIMIEQDIRHASFMTSVYSPLNISDLENSNPSYDTLLLLKSLEGMNRFMFHLILRGQIRAFAEGRISDLDDLKEIVPRVPQKEFLSSKLSEKLEQQMCDHLVPSVGAMPLWCNQLMDSCPFLFSFDTKCRYFRLAAFGLMPSEPQQSSQSGSGGLSDRRVSTSSSPHRKFVVSRDRVLESATQIMEFHKRNKVPLEVEYYEEVGTGLGPTLEFYTLVSHEFQNSGLGMWRNDHISVGKDLHSECSRTLLAPFGLFPRPWPSNLDESDDIKFTEVINKFVLLGQVVAKALQEGRILDMPFSKSFYTLILGQELTMFDIPSFDPEFGRTLLEFQALVERKGVMESGCGGSSFLECCPFYRDTKIEDLCLNFTLPGYPDYVFTTDPDDTMVNMSNLEKYIIHIVDATIHNGISRQVEAFKCGFNEVFPIEKLGIFTEEELEHLLCGEHESWNYNDLLDHIKFDHGYTASSPPIINLLEIILELDREQRRAFLQFVTGAPRLPLGGLVSLNPKLTIVRKHSANPADTDLPSVMTCANYLKLPPYSSKEVMKKKLLYAITEGQGSFHLS